MARAYGAILGALAFATVLWRGVIQGASLDGTLKVALVAAFVFTGIGMMAGTVAAATVTEAVKNRANAELVKRQRSSKSK